ncbi:peptide-methionine (R)-S-oxide reductase MsrB [Paraglaciecola arctica]|uniref:peptide-methionine (R)-S-oxide reductase MsrB n=1 Tax=Paraglaciecola arctica TaxID=1128911 RepID=UPI001C06ADDE|nr:peptide-methionine (R)-S-oxide reductase MsrB [Paraglaciecola arctica]MBU3003835.1 peptide-methionine (R)-S-oxide reductase MsrB [Paraglaciecola arctica]
MNRRKFITSTIATATSIGLGGTVFSVLSETPSKKSRTAIAVAQQWQDFLPKGYTGSLALTPIELSEQEWQKRLSSAAFDVLREEGTEPPGSSALNKQHRDGIYACEGCELPLFTSAMKYESGTGWPSFFTHIPGHLATKRDFKLIWPRTEYHCIRCGGHQGHVFDDGPKPTGQRWCNNGVALKFLPK